MTPEEILKQTTHETVDELIACDFCTYRGGASNAEANVPRGVLRGIEDIERGNTASKEKLKEMANGNE